MATRSRPWKPTKRCSRCGTTFPTRYAWREHTARECDHTIHRWMSAALNHRMDYLERHLIQHGTMPIAEQGMFKGYQRDDLNFAPRGDVLTLETMEALRAQLGPPQPQMKLRAMPKGVVPAGEIWILGDAETLARAFPPRKGGT